MIRKGYGVSKEMELRGGHINERSAGALAPRQGMVKSNSVFADGENDHYEIDGSFTRKGGSGSSAGMSTVATHYTRQSNKEFTFIWCLKNDKNFPTTSKDLMSIAVQEGGYVAVYKDGSCTFDGVSEKVVKALRPYHTRYVALGPDNQYFVAYDDGGCKWNSNSTTALDKAISDNHSTVEVLAFGFESQFYIRFADGAQVWSQQLNSEVVSKIKTGLVMDLWLGKAGAYFVWIQDPRGGDWNYFRGLPANVTHMVIDYKPRVQQVLVSDDFDGAPVCNAYFFFKRERVGGADEPRKLELAPNPVLAYEHPGSSEDLAGGGYSLPASSQSYGPGSSGGHYGELSKKGFTFTWSLSEEEGFPTTSADLVCVAIQNGGYIAIFKDGSYVFQGIDEKVVAVLRSGQMKYIALGPEGQFFVSYADGSCKWNSNGQNDLDDAIKSNTSHVELVVFGFEGHYYIRFSDGVHLWSELISDEIQEKFRAERIIDLWLGRNDTYFIWSKELTGDGEWNRARGLPSNVQKLFSQYKPNVQQILIGEDYSGNPSDMAYFFFKRDADIVKK